MGKISRRHESDVLLVGGNGVQKRLVLTMSWKLCFFKEYMLVNQVMGDCTIRE